MVCHTGRFCFCRPKPISLAALGGGCRPIKALKRPTLDPYAQRGPATPPNGSGAPLPAATSPRKTAAVKHTTDGARKNIKTNRCRYRIAGPNLPPGLIVFVQKGTICAAIVPPGGNRPSGSDFGRTYIATAIVFFSGVICPQPHLSGLWPG